MKKRLLSPMKWLMLFALLSSSLYGADNINAITGPDTMSKCKKITLTVDFEASEERTIAVYLQSLNPKKMYFYKRYTVNADDTTLNATFSIPNNIPTDGTFRYKAYIAPKGGKWSSNLGYAIQEGVKVIDVVQDDTVKSITGPASINIEEEVTLTVDYVASQERTLAVYLKTTTGTKKNYFYKRITVQAGDELEEVTFTLPENAPTNATYKYGTYIAPKGKYYKDHLCRVYQHGVKVKDTKPLTRDELIQRIKNWANDPSQANADAITNANTSEITDMSQLFYRWSSLYNSLSSAARANIQTFNIAIENWDTSSVTNMSEMFVGNTAFNQPIGDWNTSSVTDMSYMFSDNTAFNQPIGDWNTSSVTDMNTMFGDNTAFNQPIGDWNISSVTNMSGMFVGNTAFNQPIGDWNTSSVIDMSYMFSENTAFNQPIGDWNTSSVTDMSYMFVGNTAFNQPIGDWNTSSVTNMSGMFLASTAFNQPIGDWNTSSVTDMSYMFLENFLFNQSIENWDISSVDNFEYFASPSALEDKHNPFLK